MTPHDTFDACLGAFARAVGASLPERSEGDAVVLSIDGLEVEFREDADSQAVVLAAEIGEMPPDAEGVFAALALRANFASLGATALSLDAETGDLFATASLPLALADPGDLSTAEAAWLGHVRDHVPRLFTAGAGGLDGSCRYCASLAKWNDPDFRAKAAAWIAANEETCRRGSGGPGPTGGTAYAR